MKKVRRVLFNLLLVVSIFAVGCIDAFALTKNELKIVGKDINTMTYSLMINSDATLVEGEIPSVDLINEYTISKLAWNEDYITNYDKLEEGEFPIYKVPASTFESIILNSFDVNEAFLVNYRANFEINYEGFGEWYESKYYEENGTYYYTFQTPAGMGFAIEEESIIKGYKELSDGKYEILLYSVYMEPTENFSTANKVKDVDYLVKNNEYYEINGWGKFVVKLSNGYTKFYSYQSVEKSNVSFSGLTIVDQPTYDPKLDFLNGEKQNFNIEGKDLLTFRIDADVSLLDDVYMDTEIVDSKYYTVKSGSTIITFNKEYTKKLGTGEHTLLVSYTDGTYAETTFKLSIGNPETFGNGYEVVILLGLFVGMTIIMIKRGKKVSF